MDISVIGGGITGLATALCLHRLGISCRVYEKAPALHVSGAGIMMQPNAMRILDHLGVGEKIIRDDLMDIHRLETWHKGRVCLLGDAAHAMTPNMGQGGCQGIEDAWCLSQIMSAIPDFWEAFTRFEKVRRRKVDSIVRNSWQFGKLVHSTMGRIFLKQLIRMVPDAVIRRRMRKLYSVKLDYSEMIL